MRAGWPVSAITHVGVVLLLLKGLPAASEIPAFAGAVVPVEIVAIAPESNVRALAEPILVEELAPEESEQTVEEVIEEAPAPNPQPRPQERPRNEFDLAAIARMVDKQRDPGRERAEGAPADRNQRGAGPGTAEVAALEDRVRALTRAHLLRCWRMPIDLPEPDRLVVTVQFELNRNGGLTGQPRVTSPSNYTFDPAMRAAADAALRAVRACDPYPFPDDPAVGAYYQAWDQLEFTFRPRL